MKVSTLKRWVRNRRFLARALAKQAVPAPIRIQARRLLSVRNGMISRKLLRTQFPTPELLDEYQRLLAGNVSSVLLKIMDRFYADLGVDGHSIPLVKALRSFRQGLPVDDLTAGRGQGEPVLIKFERAYALLESNQDADALALFESIFHDPQARRFVPYDPYTREAVVRSGQFLGRFHEKRGDTETAIAIYREIVTMDGDGLIARRLTLLLSRRGEFREASEFAEIASTSKLNLFPRIAANNRYIASLETDFLGK